MDVEHSHTSIRWFTTSDRQIAELFEAMAEMVNGGLLSICEAYAVLAPQHYPARAGRSADYHRVLAMFTALFEPHEDAGTFNYWWDAPSSGSSRDRTARVIACLLFAEMAHRGELLSEY
jgi:hypothetical protein